MAPATAACKIAAASRTLCGAALLALGLAVPILALRTEQNIHNQPVLQPRWGYVAVAVALAFGPRASPICWRPRLPARRPQRLARPARARSRPRPSAC